MKKKSQASIKRHKLVKKSDKKWKKKRHKLVKKSDKLVKKFHKLEKNSYITEPKLVNLNNQISNVVTKSKYLD